MGICLSCLGLSQETPSHGEASETSRLLDSSSAQPQYGAGFDTALAYQDADPDQQRHERETLNAIWKSTSDKLIDISSTSTPAVEHQVHDGTGEIAFARLFRETFPRGPRARTTPEDADGGPAGQNEQDWLREIITRDGDDKRWDCNTVYTIGKPLIIEFD